MLKNHIVLLICTSKRAMSAIINLAILLLILGFAYKMLNRFVPIQPFTYTSTLTDSELKERFKVFYNNSVIGFIVGMPICTYGLHWLLNKLILLRLDFLADVKIIVVPFDLMIWLHAVLLSYLLLVQLISTLNYNYILTDWEEFLYFVNAKFKNDFVTTMARFNRLYTFIMILFTLMMFDWFTTFGDEEIKVNSFWGLGTTKYAYAHVEELLDVQRRQTILGNIYNSPYYVIKFKNGARWKSVYSGFSTYEENTKIMGLVSGKVNVYIKNIELE